MALSVCTAFNKQQAGVALLMLKGQRLVSKITQSLLQLGSNKGFEAAYFRTCVLQRVALCWPPQLHNMTEC